MFFTEGDTLYEGTLTKFVPGHTHFSKHTQFCYPHNNFDSGQAKLILLTSAANGDIYLMAMIVNGYKHTIFLCM